MQCPSLTAKIRASLKAPVLLADDPSSLPSVVVLMRAGGQLCWLPARPTAWLLVPIPYSSLCPSDLKPVCLRETFLLSVGVGCSLRTRKSSLMPFFGYPCWSSQFGLTPGCPSSSLGMSFPFCEMKDLQGADRWAPSNNQPGAKGKKSACGDKGLLMTSRPNIHVPNSSFWRCLVFQLLQQVPLTLSLNRTGLEGVLYIWAAAEGRRVGPYHKCSFPGTHIYVSTGTIQVREKPKSLKSA